MKIANMHTLILLLACSNTYLSTCAFVLNSVCVCVHVCVCACVFIHIYTYKRSKNKNNHKNNETKK